MFSVCITIASLASLIVALKKILYDRNDGNVLVYHKNMQVFFKKLNAHPA